MGLGQNITTLRKRMGLTQEKLAEKCEVSRQAVTKWESGESEPSIDKLVALSDMFGVSIDDLVKNSFSGEFTNNNKKVDYGLIEMFINKIREYRMLDASTGGYVRYKLLIHLITLAKDRYIDRLGNVRDKYLVCNTNESDRERFIILYVNDMFTTMESEIGEEYIQGNIEIDEFFDRLCAEYDKLAKECYSLCDDIRSTSTVKNHFTIWSRAGIDELDSYSEKGLNKHMEKLRGLLHENKNDSLIERFLLFYASEIDKAVQDKNDELLKEIWNDLFTLRDFVWYKAKEQLKD